MLTNPLLYNKTEIDSKQVGEKIINLADQTWQIPENFSYQVVEITKEFVARTDLVSQQMYGTTIYSDLLCKLNNISNPFELNEGDIIIVPDNGEISNFYYKETFSEEDTNDLGKPIAKKKTEKRKPNEAVIGDKRFKVDKAKKIIIY